MFLTGTSWDNLPALELALFGLGLVGAVVAAPDPVLVPLDPSVEAGKLICCRLTPLISLEAAIFTISRTASAWSLSSGTIVWVISVSYTHLRAHETGRN